MEREVAQETKVNDRQKPSGEARRQTEEQQRSRKRKKKEQRNGRRMEEKRAKGRRAEERKTQPKVVFVSRGKEDWMKVAVSGDMTGRVLRRQISGRRKLEESHKALYAEEMYVYRAGTKIRIHNDTTLAEAGVRHQAYIQVAWRYERPRTDQEDRAREAAEMEAVKQHWQRNHPRVPAAVVNQFRLEQEQTENITRQRLSATTRWQDGNGAEPAREEVALLPPLAEGQRWTALAAEETRTAVTEKRARDEAEETMGAANDPTVPERWARLYMFAPMLPYIQRLKDTWRRRDKQRGASGL